MNYRAGPSVHRYRSGEVLSRVIDDSGLIDTGASCHATTLFTHIQGRSHARLDKISVSSTLISRDLLCETVAVSFSDHCVVVSRLGRTYCSKFRPQWEL